MLSIYTEILESKGLSNSFKHEPIIHNFRDRIEGEGNGDCVTE